MKKAKAKIPYVAWRDGRPRFVPGASMRARGMTGKDLRHDNGEWFSFEEARKWSEAFALGLSMQQAAEAAPEAAARERKRSRPASQWSIGHLVEHWLKDPRLNGKPLRDGKKVLPPLSANTVLAYRKSRNLIRDFDGGGTWAIPVAGLTVKRAKTIVDDIWKARGLAQARAARAALSAAWSWAIDNNKVDFNPFTAGGKTLPTLPVRVRYGSIEEMKALVAAADAIDLPHIGDAIVLGLFTGQRQNDRLALEDGQLSADGIVFRQSKKHGQPLLIPEAPWLAERIAAARRRRAGWRVNYPHVILDETVRRPYDAEGHRYRKHFRMVRAAAIAGIKAGSSEAGKVDAGFPASRASTEGWRVEPCPTLNDFRDQDLRDTAVTWLALAGCELIQIISITGHTLNSAGNILKHYLGLHPELAKTAIGKLVDWFQAHERTRGQ